MASSVTYTHHDYTRTETPLKNAFNAIMQQYADIQAEVKRTQEFKHPFREVIATQIPNIIDNHLNLPANYKIVGSYGKGRWTDVPWIAVFDSRITVSALKGVYIVYLLNKDTKELYLTLNQGATDAAQQIDNDASDKPLAFTGIAKSQSSKVQKILLERAAIIRKSIQTDKFYSDTGIQCGSTAYDAGTIYYKKYTLETLPSDQNLLADLKDLLDLYAKYYEIFIAKNPADNDGWWPSEEEYNLPLKKADWVKYILEVEAPNHPSPMKMLKGMMELGGEASCKQLSDTYGGHPSVYAGCAMNLGRRVKKHFNLPACMDGDQERYFPFPFLGKYQGSSQDNYIYKIRPELLAALDEIDLSGISPYYEAEHKLGQFDSWEILDENTAIKHCDKSFFEYRGSGVPKGICWFFDADDMELGETKIVTLIYNGAQYQGSVKNESTDRRRVRIFWSTELGNLFNAFNVPDASATFKKIANDTYAVSIEGGEKEMTIKEKIEAIKSYIATRGFNYEGDLIENFYLSLKSKPFVILAGTSGTGKTRLVKLFAEAIGAKMQLVPVRPDWSDSSDLFGHNDLSGKFHPGAIIDFVKQAEWDKSTPHFLCLDEMNLARVEYYLSDFLSIIETRDRNENGVIETDALVDASYFQAKEAREKYGRVYLPENLYIIGTVNMDETTFPFSKKVLDRANTIEFSFVNLMTKATAGGKAVAQKLDNSFLKTEYLYLRDCDDEELIDNICFDLEELNQILVKANLHVGYRVRDEISFYMMNNKKADLLAQEAAFDHEIMQKILPRVQGSSAAIKEVLSELFIKCAGDYTGFAGAAAYEQMNSYLDSKSCKYPNSTKKIAFMMRRYEEDGFTSYWL